MKKKRKKCARESYSENQFVSKIGTPNLIDFHKKKKNQTNKKKPGTFELKNIIFPKRTMYMLFKKETQRFFRGFEGLSIFMPGYLPCCRKMQGSFLRVDIKPTSRPMNGLDVF